MPYSNKNIKRDDAQVPVPQYFNDTADDYEAVKGADGAIYTQITGAKVDSVTLLPTTSTGAPLSGTLYPPKGAKTLRIAVTGTGTYSLQVKGVMDSVTSTLRIWDNTSGGYVTSNSVTATGSYDIDVQGYDNVQAYLASLSGGNITVTGRWLV